MAVQKLNAPPIRTPLIDSQGFVTAPWAAWFERLWRKTGAESNVAPLDISGVAAQASVATTAESVPPMATAGAPVVSSDPGSFAYDSGTGTRYYNPTGDSGDWVVLA